MDGGGKCTWGWKIFKKKIWAKTLEIKNFLAKKGSGGKNTPTHLPSLLSVWLEKYFFAFGSSLVIRDARCPTDNA